eukprot:gene17338-11757_t
MEWPPWQHGWVGMAQQRRRCAYGVRGAPRLDVRSQPPPPSNSKYVNPPEVITTSHNQVQASASVLSTLKGAAAGQSASSCTHHNHQAKHNSTSTNANSTNTNSTNTNSSTSAYVFQHLKLLLRPQVGFRRWTGGTAMVTVDSRKARGSQPPPLAAVRIA